jgi:hypothetical protein
MAPKKWGSADKGYAASKEFHLVFQESGAAEVKVTVQPVC